MSVTQQHRSIQLVTPLGKDVLWFYRMQGSEELGRPYEFVVEALANDPNLKASKLLGQIATVTLVLPDDSKRYFSGFVTGFGLCGTVGAYPLYRLILRPWLWLLSRNSNCRIFQNMKVPDIVKQVFRDQNFSDFKDSLNGSYREREYCVQYRESDFNFASRLMEEEGIYYFFEHDDKKHTLVLADAINSHTPFSGYAQISYYDPGNPARRKHDHISEWSIFNEFQAGLFTHTDFDFTKPNTDLITKAAISRSHENSKLEYFDYPGEYQQTSDGDAYARCRIEELQTKFETTQGAGNARGLATGSLFKLEHHPLDDQNSDYLVISANYELQSDEYLSTPGGTNQDIYQCTFTALAQKTPFRPERITRRPFVQGPQTAFVVGPKGEELYTDKYGRVKVKFHWDRYNKADEKSSCWVRVCQPWAGKNWGMIALPRIGQEVVVDFLEGDPDQPIIIGRFYNDNSMPPYPLPDKANIFTIKSNTTKGGGGFNELRFDDTKGEEQVFMHAERNLDLRVKKDAMEWIGNERHVIIKKDLYEQVEGDHHAKVQGDRTEQIQGVLSVKVDQNIQEKAGMKHALEAGQEIHLKGGMNVVIEAGMSVTLKAGGGFIVIGPAGVTISGTPVLINSGGSAGSGSGANTAAPKAPKEAADDKAGSKDNAPSAPAAPAAASSAAAASSSASPPPPPDPSTFGPSAQALLEAADMGMPFCEKCVEAAASMLGL
jgi:type VI secretion system secreted protein VgrG